MSNKKIQKIFKEDLEEITKLYSEGHSIADIAVLWEVSFVTMQRYFKRCGIKTRTLKEAKKSSPKTEICLNALADWRKTHETWTKGLTKDDPRMASLIEKGRNTQIKNGKSSGKNNPMYGKMVHSFRNGFREDLTHPVRSSWEANFARILIHLKLDYEYEKHTFELPNEQTYTPDFFVPSKNKYYEVRGHSYNDKYQIFIKKCPHIKITLVDENVYTRLIRHFSRYLSFEDKVLRYSREQIKDKFIEYCKQIDKRPSVQEFCNMAKISARFIRKLFGSESLFVGLFYSAIREIEIQRLINKFEETNRTSRRKFYKYYRRGASLVANYFGSFTKFKEYIK